MVEGGRACREAVILVASVVVSVARDAFSFEAKVFSCLKLQLLPATRRVGGRVEGVCKSWCAAVVVGSASLSFFVLGE